MKSQLKCKCGKVVNFSKSDFARLTKEQKENFMCSECLSKPPKMGEKKASKKEYESKLDKVMKKEDKDGENSLS